MSRFPIPAYLIEHPKGHGAVSITGMQSRTARTDPTGHIPGKAGRASCSACTTAPAEEVERAAQRRSAANPAKIDVIINSHLHFDHVGGNATIPQRHRRGAAAGSGRPGWIPTVPPGPARAFFPPRTTNLGHKVQQNRRRARNLFGDGRKSCACRPTGHHARPPGRSKLRPSTPTTWWAPRVGARSCSRPTPAYFLPQPARAPPAARRNSTAEGMLRHLRPGLAALEAGGARRLFLRPTTPSSWATVPQAPTTIT